MTDTNITTLRPSPHAGEGTARGAKDPTAPLRARRARRKRKAVATVTVPVAKLDIPSAEKPNEIKPSVTVERHGVHAIDVTAYVAAIALAGAGAWFSIRGMVVLFPGSPMSVVGMAVAMESAKLVTAGWLARRWRVTSWIWRLVLVALVAGLAVINAAGVYAQLVAAHVGDRGAATSLVETQTATLAARIDVQAHTVADLDRRLGQIDSAIEKATEKGRTTAAMKLADGQRKARAGLVEERKREAGTHWPPCRPNAPA